MGSVVLAQVTPQVSHTTSSWARKQIFQLVPIFTANGYIPECIQFSWTIFLHGSVDLSAQLPSENDRKTLERQGCDKYIFYLVLVACDTL